MEKSQSSPAQAPRPVAVRGPAPSSHPCLSCGACCAFFRVAFYWREAEETVEGRPGPVPVALTEDLDSHQRCMKGTNRKRGGHCVALQGRVGKQASCAIYDRRPSPCRAFPASYEEGRRNQRCDQARAAHGLPPLGPRDWLPPRPASHSGSPERGG